MTRPVFTSVNSSSVRGEEGMMVFTLSNRLDGTIEFAVSPALADHIAERMSACRPYLVKPGRGGRPPSVKVEAVKPDEVAVRMEALEREAEVARAERAEILRRIDPDELIG